LRKLSEANLIDSATLDRLVSLTHVLDGEGDKYEYMCRLAKSQGAHPILLLDGDKHEQVAKVREKHPDVPIVILDVGKEFEQLVPQANYIKAAAELCPPGVGPENVTAENYDKWEEHLDPIKRSKMFSKLVDRWLDEEFGVSLSKPRLMKKAIELTDATAIAREPFQDLIREMTNIAESL